MNERVMQFRVGVFILATIMISAILVLLFAGSSPWFHGTYTIYIKFSDAPGVFATRPSARPAFASARCATCSWPTTTRE